jgi:hypothetical protein
VFGGRISSLMHGCGNRSQRALQIQPHNHTPDVKDYGLGC